MTAVVSVEGRYYYSSHRLHGKIIYCQVNELSIRTANFVSVATVFINRSCGHPGLERLQSLATLCTAGYLSYFSLKHNSHAFFLYNQLLNTMEINNRGQELKKKVISSPSSREVSGSFKKNGKNRYPLRWTERISPFF